MEIFHPFKPGVVPQDEAEAGIATIERIWTAERVKQAIAALETGGANGDDEHIFYPDQIKISVGSDWAVNAGAPTEADSVNAALDVVKLVEASETGFGFPLRTKSGKTNLQINTLIRARTGVAGKQVALKLYHRKIPKAGVPAAWSAGTVLAFTAIVGADQKFYFKSQTLTFASESIDADEMYQWQFTRVPADASDTLVGDALLGEITVTFK